MSPPSLPPPRALNWFAWFTAAATLVLIGVGGLVTSHGAGLAVPDWPNTYGYNMFFFPISKWVGGILYEHTHRLVASCVGLLTTLLAVWLWLSPRHFGLRWLGAAAFLGVVLQGVLGGLRVTLIRDELGIVHATLAQLFLLLVSALALMTTQAWSATATLPQPPRRLRRLLWATAAVILVQLVLGATMRHQHAGLAVPDFPFAYGRWWPPLDAASIEAYNQNRLELHAANPITAFHVVLHLVHRLTAAAILGLVVTGAWLAWRELGWQRAFTKMCFVWLALVLAQVGLGAAAVWTGKSADITTAHVVIGAVTFVVGASLALWSTRAPFPLAAPATRTAGAAGGMPRPSPHPPAGVQPAKA